MFKRRRSGRRWRDGASGTARAATDGYAEDHRVNNCQLKQAALPWRYPAVWWSIRAVRLVYGSPATDVDRSDHVGRPSEAAGCATKRGLCFAVGFVDMSTAGHSPRRIARINAVDGNTRQPRFVGEKRLELRKRPAMQRCALRPASLDPRANVRQVFDRYRSLRAFGLRNNAFGDHVVGVR